MIINLIFSARLLHKPDKKQKYSGWEILITIQRRIILKMENNLNFLWVSLPNYKADDINWGPPYAFARLTYAEKMLMSVSFQFLHLPCPNRVLGSIIIYSGTVGVPTVVKIGYVPSV